MPTGTMSNLCAIMAHCDRRGSEILVGCDSHIHIYEQGGCATLASCHPRAVVSDRGSAQRVQPRPLNARALRSMFLRTGGGFCVEPRCVRPPPRAGPTYSPLVDPCNGGCTSRPGCALAGCYSPTDRCLLSPRFGAQPTDDDGTLSVAAMEVMVRPVDDHFPTTRLVCLETTHNK